LIKKIQFGILFLIIISLFYFFNEGLKTDKIFSPKKNIGQKLSNFSAPSIFNNQIMITQDSLKNKKFYMINIWASWCAPCREEHPYLMQLSEENLLKIVGINYKDKKNYAITFLKKFGNPYSEIGSDKNGTISIDLGARGVPESILLDDKKNIVAKFIGPLKKNDYKKIIKIIKINEIQY